MLFGKKQTFLRGFLKDDAFVMFFVVDSLIIVIWTVCQMFGVNLFTAGFLGSSLDHLPVHYFLMSGFCSVLSDVVDWEDCWQMWTPVLSFVMKLGQFSVCCMLGVPFCPDWGLFVISRRNYLNPLHTELSAVYDVFPSTESSASMTSAILTTSRQKFWNDDFKPPLECRYLRCVIKPVSLGFCITSVTDRISSLFAANVMSLGWRRYYKHTRHVHWYKWHQQQSPGGSSGICSDCEERCCKSNWRQFYVRWRQTQRAQCVTD